MKYQCQGIKTYPDNKNVIMCTFYAFAYDIYGKEEPLDAEWDIPWMRLDDKWSYFRTRNPDVSSTMLLELAENELMKELQNEEPTRWALIPKYPLPEKVSW